MQSRTDPSIWMWARACALVDQAERIQRQFFRPATSRGTPIAWEPPADVYESDREIVVIIAMPGVTPERMQIDSEPGVLVVRGSRSFPLIGPGHAVRQLEIPHGNFERRISLPPGRLELGAPEVDQGCVVLRLRKLGWARP
jgi:HSP20 family protein